MKLTRALTATILLGAIIAIPAPGAQAGTGTGTGEVTIAQMATYAPDEDFPLTICIDDVIVDNGVGVAAGTVLDPIAVSVGTHTLEFFQGDTCEGDSFVGTDFDVEAGDDMTLMSWWSAETQDIAVFDNDVSCVPADEARLTVRNAGAAEPVDLVLTPWGGVEETVVSDVATGEEAVAELASGPYVDGVFIDSISESVVISLGDHVIDTNGENQVLYLFAGADSVEGAEDYYYTTYNDRCEVFSTDTLPPRLPNSATTQAVAAVTTPRFTG